MARRQGATAPLLRLFPIFLSVLAQLVPAPATRAAGGDVPVRLTIQAGLSGDRVRLRGEATVPDGTWIIYVVYRAAAPGTRANGFAKVAGGRYRAEVDVSGWPPGRIAIDAHFQILLPGRKQPAEAIARYGPKGERMVGPTVAKGGAGFRAAVVSTAVVKR